MRSEPNFPVRPDEFVGRSHHIEAFREALQQGLTAGRTSSFAILGDWGIGKSSLLLKFAEAAGVTFQADRTEIKPFESPVSKLRAQTGLQVWHSQQCIPGL